MRACDRTVSARNKNTARREFFCGLCRDRPACGSRHSGRPEECPKALQMDDGAARTCDQLRRLKRRPVDHSRPMAGRRRHRPRAVRSWCGHGRDPAQARSSRPQIGGGAQPRRRSIQVGALPGVYLSLAIQRQLVGIFDTKSGAMMASAAMPPSISSAGARACTTIFGRR